MKDENLPWSFFGLLESVLRRGAPILAAAFFKEAEERAVFRCEWELRQQRLQKGSH